MHDDNKLNLPYRKYIFAGEVEPAKLPDGSDNPLAGQPVWCFAYGKKEWVSPERHPLTNQPLTWQGYKDLALADSTRQISCN